MKRIAVLGLIALLIALGFVALVMPLRATAQLNPSALEPSLLRLGRGTKTATSTTATITTNGTTAAGNATLHFAATTGVVDGMGIVDATTGASIPGGTVVLSHTATTVVMSANAAGAGVGGTDSIVFSGAALNKSSGVITTEALTTAAAGTYTLTIADNLVAAGDIPGASVALGTDTTGTPEVITVTAAAGTLFIVIRNGHASAALNGTLKIQFWNFKS